MKLLIGCQNCCITERSKALFPAPQRAATRACNRLMEKQYKIRHARRDEVILREGIENHKLYKVLSGKAAMYYHYGRKDEYMIGILSESKYFGEMGMLTGKREGITITAVTDLEYMAIPGDEFNTYIAENPESIREIMADMANLIRMLGMNVQMLKEEVDELNIRDIRKRHELDLRVNRFMLYTPEGNMMCRTCVRPQKT